MVTKKEQQRLNANAYLMITMRMAGFNNSNIFIGFSKVGVWFHLSYYIYEGRWGIYKIVTILKSHLIID